MAVEFTEENIQKLFGHEAAEDEDPKRLKEYYFKGSVYDQVAADLPLRVLVGHKGIGKSALFKVSMAELTEANEVAILIQPNDVESLALEGDGILSLIKDWTEGLSRIVARKTLANLGINAELLGEDVALDPVRAVRDLIQGPTWTGLKSANADRIVQFEENPRVTVFVDDLDRGWEARPRDVTRISALLNAVRDMSNKRAGLSFRVALRSDVYYAVRTSDESTDKIEGSVIWHSWTNHEIFLLLAKRIETFFGRDLEEAAVRTRRQRELVGYLEPVFEPRFTGRGHWANAPTYSVLMSLVRKRPRDLVKLCTLAARHAYARRGERIGTHDLEASFEAYSTGRVQDTVNEYRSELPNVEALIMNMKPNRKERQAKMGYVYKTGDLLEKIDNIMKNHNFSFSGGRAAYRQDLAAFMYKVNFITARKEADDGTIVRKYFEDSRYLSATFADFGFDWEVHPAYRWALQPDDINSIFQTLQLSQDDE